MSDEWVKERDEAAYIAVDKLFLMPRTDEAGRGLFISGADFGRAYEQKRAAKLVECLNIALGELSGYAAGRRDDSFEGWQKEWREVPIKHESDYEFYPNHVTKEFIHELYKALADYRSKE